MPTNITRTATAVVIALLSACSSLQDSKAPPTYQWQMSAKVAVRTDTESGSARAIFTQSTDTVKLELSGAMGLRSLTIECKGQHCMTLDAAGTSHSVKPNKGLIELLPNTFVPVYELFLWVRGKSPTESESVGWRVTTELDGSASNTLPTRITLEHELGARIKIAVIQWNEA